MLIQKKHPLLQKAGDAITAEIDVLKNHPFAVKSSRAIRLSRL